MANTRQIDRLIRAAEAKLRGIKAGEVSALSVGEQARVAVHVGRGVRRIMRGKGAGPADRAIDRIFATAEEKVAAELSAAHKARQKAITESASASVARKTESKWW